MSRVSWSLFIGPYFLNNLPPNNIAAVKWFSFVYNSYEEYSKDIIAISYDSYWPKGKLNPGWKDGKSLKYLNILGIRRSSKLFSLLLNILRKSIIKGRPQKIYIYNPSKEHVLCAKILNLFKVSSMRLFLLDYNLEKNTIRKLVKVVSNFDRCYVGSYWLNTKLWPLCANTVFFSGGISNDISVAKPDGKTIIYAGKYDSYGGVDDIVSAIQKARTGEFNWVFTGNCNHSKIRWISQTRTDVVLTGILSENDLNQYIKKSSYCLVPGNPNSNSWYTVFPSKVWTYAQSNGYIISAPYPGYPPNLRSKIIIVEDFRKNLLDVLRSLRESVKTEGGASLHQYRLSHQIRVIYD